MPSSRLFEMLAEAGAKPSGAFQDASAAMDAVNQGASSALKYQKDKRLDTKLADLLGDSSYGDMRLRDVSDKSSGLLELFKLKAENAPVDVNTTDYSDPSNPAIKKIGTASRHSQFVKPDVPNNLDEIIAGKVSRGELSLKEAAKIKASMSPSMFPKPEPGFRFGPNGELLPIPGGTPARKIAEEEAKKQAAIDAQQAEANLIIGKIDEALSQVSGSSAGAMAGTKNIPVIGQMTGATDLGANLDTITSSLGLNKLMEMKNNSKAGASGMGALSDREMTLLTSALTSIKQAQKPEQLKKHLTDAKTHYQNILKMSRGINPFGSETGDPEADQAIAMVNASSLPPEQKAARITAIKARATQGAPRQ